MATPTPKPFDPALMTSSELNFLMKRPFYNTTIIDSQELRRRVHLEAPQTWRDAKMPFSGMGNLDMLPLEVQFNLFAATPISDLFNLRATNSYAKYMIEQWEPFRSVMTYAPDTIRGLVVTRAGHLWTTPQLFEVLFTTRCEFCGEHGEILQLLKLKRCCLRCLSQERELLAINKAYARQALNLTCDDLEQLPVVVSMPQDNFWGLPSGVGPAYDYQAVLGIINRRIENGCWRKPTSLGTQPGRSKTSDHSVVLSNTGISLAPEETTRYPPRRRTTLQDRRRQPTLQLLKHEISPPETCYVQHSCAVQIPAMTRKLALQKDGTTGFSIKKIEAVHCEGCAAYWNYHSPLPWQFHRQFPHHDGSRGTDFTGHLQHCVYAHLHWTLVHNPWRPLELAEVISRLNGYRMCFYPRQPADTIEESNEIFEKIPFVPQLMMEFAELDIHSFQPACTWPSSNANGDDNDNDNGFTPPESHAQALLRERLRQRAFLNPPVRHDHYWDALFSQEALSQSNWACANPRSAQMCLFRGPVSLLMRRWQHADKKYVCPRTRSGRQPPWGFDRFGR